MKSLADLARAKSIEKQILKHPRHKLLDEMVKAINLDRRDTKYKPITPKIVAIKTSHLSLDDLHYLLKKMQQSSAPGKVFFGSLKVKK